MLYLASQSPQRRTLLAQAQIAFEIVPSSCDEESIKLADPVACAQARAEAKARGADLLQCTINKDCVILGVDTIAILDGKMIGKPRDRQDARHILQALQNSVHQVITTHFAWCPAHDGSPERSKHLLSQTEIHMRPMTDEEINAYVDSGESDNRAGAYAIQENGDKFVDKIVGEFDTVVGLNIEAVNKLINAIRTH